MSQSDTQPDRLGAFLEQAYKEKLTNEEATEYKDRLAKFFNLLIEIDQQNKGEGQNKHNTLSEITQNIAVSLWSVGLTFMAESILDTGFLFLLLGLGVLFVSWIAGQSQGK